MSVIGGAESIFIAPLGGGGYFGGGGGGTMPGIAGGGGGGSSYVFAPLAVDHVTVAGTGSQPGGLSHKPPPPLACGLVI